MTYQTAAQHPISPRGPGSDAVYARRGFSAAGASTLRRLGVPASAAQVLCDGSDDGWAHLSWMAHTFSPKGLRRIAGRGPLTAWEVNTLRTLATDDLSTTRGYVSQTALRISEIEYLMRIGVPSRQAANWADRQVWPGGSNLADILKGACVLRGVPEGDLPGWVRFANRHRVQYRPDRHRWVFLGGDTALMAAAGLSPAEAATTTAAGGPDRAALAMMAALRGHREVGHRSAVGR